MRSPVKHPEKASRKMLLASAVVVVHMSTLLWLNHVRFPLLPRANAIGWMMLLLSNALSIAAIFYRVRSASSPTNNRWWLYLASTCITSIGTIAYLLRSLSLLGSPADTSSLPILFYQLASVPLLMAISVSFDEFWIRSVRLLDLATAFLTAALFTVLVLIVTGPSFGHERYYLIDIIFDVRNLFLASCAILRLLGIAGEEEEQQFFSSIAIILLFQAVLNSARNRAIVHHNGPFWNLVLDLLFLTPFLVLCTIEWWSSVRLRTYYPSRALASFSRISISIFMTLGAILIAIGIIRIHFFAGAAGIILALILYGARMGFLGEEKLLLDPLTGIPNRRSLDETLSREWRRASRVQSTLVLLLIDIDYFKRINDTYGHQRGDSILIEVAQALRSTLGRSSDFIGRYGGEEFLAILPALSPEGTRRLTRKLCLAVEDLRIENTKSPYGTVTISIGAVAGDNSEMHIHSPSDLLRRADKALYEAKQAGRNCVRIVGLTEENSSPDDMGLSISIDS